VLAHRSPAHRNPERDGGGKSTVLVVKDGQFVKVDY